MAIERNMDQYQNLKSVEVPGVGVKDVTHKPPRTAPPEISPGASGQVGAMPPVAEALVAEQLASDISSPTQGITLFKNLMDAIKVIMPQGLGADTEVLLLKLAKELEKTESNLQSISIQAETSRRKSDIGELNRKQEEAEAARKKAAKKSGIAKLFAKIASIVGAVAMIVGSVALSVATFGGASPSIAAATLASVALVSSAFLVANELATTITGQSLFKKMGMDDRTAMIMMIGLSVLAAVSGAGAAGLAAKGGATATSEAAKAAANVAMREVAKGATKEAAEAAVKNAVREAIKNSAKEVAKDVVEEVLENFAEAIAKKVVATALKGASKSAVQKVAETASKEALKNASGEALNLFTNPAVTQSVEAASEGGSVVSNVASKGGSVLTEGAQSAAAAGTRTTASQMLRANVGKMTSGLTMVEAATSAANAGVQFAAAEGQVQVKRIQADLKEMEALLEGLKEFLERGIKNMGDVEQMIQQLIDKAYENVKNKQQLITSIKLTA